jgi:hypothetical protein
MLEPTILLLRKETSQAWRKARRRMTVNQSDAVFDDAVLVGLDNLKTVVRVSGRAKELEDALNWVRGSKEKDDAKYDPEGVFRKTGSTLPRRPGQFDANRAKDIENALNWTRTAGFDPQRLVG